MSLIESKRIKPPEKLIDASVDKKPGCLLGGIFAIASFFYTIAHWDQAIKLQMYRDRQYMKDHPNEPPPSIF